MHRLFSWHFNLFAFFVVSSVASFVAWDGPGYGALFQNFGGSIALVVLGDSVKKLEYDLYYVKIHTLLLDLRILLKTVVVVRSGRGRANTASAPGHSRADVVQLAQR